MNYLRSEDGGAVAEYALIMALIGGALAVAIVGLRNAARTAVAGAANQVATVQVASTPSGPPGTNSTITPGTGSDPDCPSGQYNGAGKCKK